MQASEVSSYVRRSISSLNTKFSNVVESNEGVEGSNIYFYDLLDDILMLVDKKIEVAVVHREIEGLGSVRSNAVRLGGSVFNTLEVGLFSKPTVYGKKALLKSDVILVTGRAGYVSADSRFKVESL